MRDKNKSQRSYYFMEHNQNGILAIIVLVLGLVFFVSGMVYHLWGSY
jgi:hypothetical protein